MLIAGRNVLADLVAREKRLRPALGKTLDRRLAAWIAQVEAAKWRRPSEVKAVFGTADVVGGNRVVFDICGNNYRLVVQFNYVAGVALILFAGDHDDYDRLDVRTL